MKTCRHLLNVALLGVLALVAAGPAMAHGGDDYGRHGGHAWGHHKHHRHHHHQHHRHQREYVYYGAPVVVAPPPPMMMPQPIYYPAPRAYYPRRDPSVVIGVDIPPLVIPLR